jgi:hypothetical protein
MTQTKWRTQAIIMGTVMILLWPYSPPPSYAPAVLGAAVAANPNGPAMPTRQTQSGITEGGGPAHGPAMPTRQTQSGTTEGGGSAHGPAMPTRQTQSGTTEGGGPAQPATAAPPVKDDAKTPRR